MKHRIHCFQNILISFPINYAAYSQKCTDEKSILIEIYSYNTHLHKSISDFSQKTEKSTYRWNFEVMIAKHISFCRYLRVRKPYPA